MSLWVGVDPGGSETGIVTCDGAEVSGAWVVARDRLSDHAYVLEVLDCLGDARHSLGEPRKTGSGISGPEPVFLAVEGFKKPTGHLGMINPLGLMRTSLVLGAVLAVGEPDETFVIPPGGNGSRLLASYPEMLQPQRKGSKGKDWVRHCRSAYDVAQTAQRLHEAATTMRARPNAER